MNTSSDNEQFIPELKNVIRMFIPFFDSDLSIDIRILEGKIACLIKDRFFSYKPQFEPYEDSGDQKTLLREYKIALYRALSKYFNKKLPWGSLTGIRPTRLAYKLTDRGMSIKSAIRAIKKKYLISNQKADLIKRIIAGQEGLLYNCTDYINLYVHIPFCPSRCAYCSFVSLDINKSSGLIEPYLERLKEEINRYKGTFNKKILSVYIGGGTPTVLSAEQLYDLLEQISLLGVRDVEFTLEAGRPDTITAEKLAILKRFKVSRISINPQTFCQETLKAIGRNHTIADISLAYELSRKFNLDINMDLIAGLKNESIEDFTNSIKSAIELRPENITVHTLSIKNGSTFFNNNRTFNQFSRQMTQTAQKLLIKAGYSPYYLYRQKNTSDNLENIGYSLKGRQNIFNITSMEETVSVIGFGAGAITKIITPKSIERFAALRDVKLYIDDFDQMLSKKFQFLSRFK